jgi:hypothetical protein
MSSDSDAGRIQSTISSIVPAGRLPSREEVCILTSHLAEDEYRVRDRQLVFGGLMSGRPNLLPRHQAGWQRKLSPDTLLMLSSRTTFAHLMVAQTICQQLHLPAVADDNQISPQSPVITVRMRRLFDMPLRVQAYQPSESRTFG